MGTQELVVDGYLLVDGVYWDVMGFIDDPSGKRLHNYGKIHHAINGTTHYFDWAIFNSYIKSPQGLIVCLFLGWLVGWLVGWCCRLNFSPMQTFHLLFSAASLASSIGADCVSAPSQVLLDSKGRKYATAPWHGLKNMVPAMQHMIFTSYKLPSGND